MFRLLRLIALAVPVLLAAPAQAADPGKLRDLLVAVGLDVTLGSIAPSIIGSMGPLPGASDALRKQVGELVAQHFDGAAMLDDVVEALHDGMTDAQVDALAEFYRGPLGQRATALENAASRPELEAAVLSQGAVIFRRLRQADDPRVGLYERMVTSLRMVENATALVMNVSYAMMAGMMGSPQLPYNLSDDEILAVLNAQSGQIRTAMRASVFATCAYTYREMSEAELEEYVAFLETEAARDFYATTSRALAGTMLPRVKLFSHELMLLTGARKA